MIDTMMAWTGLEWLEAASYVATVFGIPIAIIVFIYEQRRERQSEQEEIYERLNDNYAEFLDVLMQYPEIDVHDKPLSDPEDARRQRILYTKLANLFEQAFIILYGDEDPAYRRMWLSWEDWINEWVKKPNFLAMLPELLQGDDSDFVQYMHRVSGLGVAPIMTR